MELINIKFKIKSELVEALDLYLRRTGACGVAFEDPLDALKIIEGQRNGDEDASIFFDPSYLDDLDDEAYVQVTYKSERLADGLATCITNSNDERIRSLSRTNKIYIYRDAKDLITDEDCYEISENIDDSSNEMNVNPYYVDNNLEIEEENADLNLKQFFPQAGGQEYCTEAHTVEEFCEIFDAHLNDFLSFFSNYEKINWTAEELEDKDWLEAYKKHYDIVRLGKSLIICPSWKSYEASGTETLINLDPESAFGTGMHASTAMCADFIESYITGEMASFENRIIDEHIFKILDLGTGSGILAIIAEKLLRRERSQQVFDIFACDIDSNAIRVAKENCLKNDCSRIETSIKSIDTIDDKYDLVIANLISDLQLKFADEYVRVMNDGACLIVSGIIEERENEIIERFNNAGLKLLTLNRMNAWSAQVWQK